MSKFGIGIASALGGALCWGLSGALMQFLLQSYDISPLFIVSVRMPLAGLFFLAFALWRKRAALLGLLRDRSSTLRAAVFGIVGMFLCQLTYIMTIDCTNAGTATVLQASNVVMVLVYACLVSRRAPRAVECLAIVLALTAAVLIATKGDLGTLSIPVEGLLWGFISAVTIAFYSCYPKKLFEQWESLPVTTVGMIFGGIVALVTIAVYIAFFPGGSVIPAQAASLDATAWLVLVAIAFVGTFASFGLYLYGVSVIGGVKGSLIGTAEPVAATIIAAVWLGTAFTTADIVGTVLMIATVFIVALQPRNS